MSSFIKVPRSIFKSKAWLKEREFVIVEAYLDLLQRASFYSHRMPVHGSVVELGPHQLICSVNSLAEKWKWKVENVEYLLENLEELGALSRSFVCGVTVITLNPNFDFPSAVHRSAA